MKWKIVAFVVLVPALNIALNLLAKKTAQVASSFYNSLTTPLFLSTMLVGTASVLCMIALYREGVAVPRGILFMGAMSILGGSLITIPLSGARFTAIEWTLFASIAVLMAVRFWQLTK